MRKSILSLLTAGLLLSACGSVRDSALNPFNWFGRSRSEPVAEGPVNPLIPKRRGVFSRSPEPEYSGALVDTIAELHVERVAGGAIIHVKGIAASQGSHDVRLVEDEDDDKPDTLTYTLKSLRSPYRELVGPPRGREIVAAQSVTDNELAGIRTIRVIGLRNARSTSRRF